ncbi:MAG: hypothetical protein ICCCNLDF_00899 [Planctomycetes bacterium]|nr:hypothetical protein [Planctomycetota bacterium]
MLIVGGAPSTVASALGPAAGALLPAKSAAVPAAMLMPRVPIPTRLLITTVRSLGTELMMATVPVTPPVPVSVISPAASVMVS